MYTETRHAMLGVQEHLGIRAGGGGAGGCRGNMPPDPLMYMF